jgi:polyhydroxyalkanoate synthesis regulator phasin
MIAISNFSQTVRVVNFTDAPTEAVHVGDLTPQEARWLAIDLLQHAEIVEQQLAKQANVQVGPRPQDRISQDELDAIAARRAVPAGFLGVR